MVCPVRLQKIRNIHEITKTSISTCSISLGQHSSCRAERLSMMDPTGSSHETKSMAPFFGQQTSWRPQKSMAIGQSHPVFFPLLIALLNHIIIGSLDEPSLLTLHKFQGPKVQRHLATIICTNVSSDSSLRLSTTYIDLWYLVSLALKKNKYRCFSILYI